MRTIGKKSRSGEPVYFMSLQDVLAVSCLSTSPSSVYFCGSGSSNSVDLETGIKDPHQPYKTLSKYRRIDLGVKYAPCFGMLCVSDKLGSGQFGIEG